MRRPFVIPTFGLALALVPAVLFAQATPARSSPRGSRQRGSAAAATAACGSPRAPKLAFSSPAACCSSRSSRIRPQRSKNSPRSSSRARGKRRSDNQAAGVRYQDLQIGRALRAERPLCDRHRPGGPERRVRALRDAPEDDDARRTARAGDRRNVEEIPGGIRVRPEPFEPHADSVNGTREKGKGKRHVFAFAPHLPVTVPFPLSLFPFPSQNFRLIPA